MLERIKDSGLKLRAEKCELFQSSGNFLGHTVSNEGERPCPDNIVKTIQWKVPRTVKQVEYQYWGWAHSKILRGYAEMVKPLIGLTKKGKKFLWFSQCEEAFSMLKKTLVSTDTMGHPTNDVFVFEGDVSDIGIGAP